MGKKRFTTSLSIENHCTSSRSSRYLQIPIWIYWTKKWKSCNPEGFGQLGQQGSRRKEVFYLIQWEQHEQLDKAHSSALEGCEQLVSDYFEPEKTASINLNGIYFTFRREKNVSTKGDFEHLFFIESESKHGI
jgi:hypothetical protein